jgi:anti-sigma28 factor (negative regulator of flagellin synthesis)
MDYSTTLLKIEVIFLGITLIYILYYSFDKILFALKRIYEMIPKSRQRNIQETSQNIVEINEDKNLHVKEYEDNGKTFTDEEKLRLSELIKKIRLNISIGEYDIAKNLVVE